MLQIIKYEESGPLAQSRRATRLEDILEQADSIGALDNDGGEVFRRKVEGTIRREPGAGRQLSRHCAKLLEGLPDPRGRPPSLTMVTHAVFCWWIERRTSTYDDLKGDFTDPVTIATRGELGAPRFSPYRAVHLARELDDPMRWG